MVEKELAKAVGEAAIKKMDKIIAQYKEKEFNRLKDYILNLISIIECGLNPNSISRYTPNDDGVIIVPSYIEIEKLHEVLFELRQNILTSEERELLNG